MDLNNFVRLFSEQLDATPAESISSSTAFKDLDDWGSLTALSIIAMIEEEMGKRITGADIRTSNTIEDLYKLALSK